MEPQKRAEDFFAEYKKLSEKYGIDLISFPSFVPDNEGGWRMVIKTQPIDKLANDGLMVSDK